MPMNDPPFTLPLRTATLLMVPALVPASAPMNWTSALAVMLTLARLRLRTTPEAPMNGNSPTESFEWSGDSVSWLIVELTPRPPLPSNRPLNVTSPKPVKPLAEKLVPSAKLPLMPPWMSTLLPIVVRSAALLTSM